jgi:hypothetical protein
LLAESAVEEGVPVLVDARASETNIGVGDMIHVATLARMLMKRGMDLVAIVANPGPILTLAKAFEVAARTFGVHAAVFETMDEARVFLRLGLHAGDGDGPLSVPAGRSDAARVAPTRSQ